MFMHMAITYVNHLRISIIHHPLHHAEAHTASEMCKDYNVQIASVNATIDESNVAIKLAAIQSGQPATLTAASLMQPMPCAPPAEFFDLKWASRHLKNWNWRKESTNTQGVYLPFAHPQMEAARHDVRQSIESGEPIQLIHY